MSRKPYIWFLLLVVFVVAYAVYDYKSDQWTEAKKAEETLLYPHKSDQVQKIQVKSGSFLIELERSPEGWKIVRPIQEVADQDAVAEFVDGIASEKSKSVAVEGDAVDWDRFGLGAGSATILLTDNLGKQNMFTIAAKKNFTGESFLRKDEEKRVYVVSSTWTQKIEKKTDDFRDHCWGHFPIGEVETMDFTVGKEKFGLFKKNAVWKSTERPEEDIDQDKVRLLVGKLSGHGFQTLEAKTEGKPLVIWNIKLKTGKEWSGELFLDHEGKDIFKVSPPEVTGEISKDWANDLLKLSAINFVKPPPTPPPTSGAKDQEKSMPPSSNVSPIKPAGTP